MIHALLSHDGQHLRLAVADDAGEVLDETLPALVPCELVWRG
jgi:hypothetical protein